MSDITVIVPVYNVEQYLTECLDSLVSQTFSDLEILCIDDGSTDSSGQILDDYAMRDSRIRVIHKENEGYGKTMNLGIREAHSAWIGIVESDDFVKPQMYEKLYHTAVSEELEVVKCNFYKYKTAYGKEIDYSHEYDETIYGQFVHPLEEPRIYQAHSSIWAALYRKDFLKKYGIWFSETSGASFQDISFQFRVLSSVSRMKIIEDALLYYRTDNAGSSVYSPSKVFCISDEMHTIENYIRQQSEQRQEKLWPILTRKKFYDYLWNYKRLAPQLQYMFFQLMEKEFQVDAKEGKFREIAWERESDRQILEQILDSPMEYFSRTVARNYRDERFYQSDILNDRLYRSGVLYEIEHNHGVILYGAGLRGKNLLYRLLELGVEKVQIRFAVTRTDDNTESEIEGIPVVQADVLLRQNKKRLVIIAVKGDARVEILNYLKNLGAENIIVSDDEFLHNMWN